MEAQDSKLEIIKETLPSEIVSLVGGIAAGIVLTLLILPFESFSILILIIPALLSLRGNLSGPFIARTSRDFIIGEFNRRSWLENVMATYSLSIITALLIGIFCNILNFFLFQNFIVHFGTILLIPLISILMALSASIPTSTFLNFLAFKRGFNPNNVVGPIMTAFDDSLTVLSFYLTLLLLGVP